MEGEGESCLFPQSSRFKRGATCHQSEELSSAKQRLVSKHKLRCCRLGDGPFLFSLARVS